ncbi:MAG: alpha-mannosidase [Paenibacillus sp.]|nr:alpha-mannosidase [Paenibacillus sp.]
MTEIGPLRAKLRVINRYNRSVLQQDFILYRDKPGIEVKVKLDWREEHKMLKLSFPVQVSDPKAVYEIPYGHIERPVNGEEEPGQQWTNVTGVTPVNGKLSSYGLTLLNDAKYSFDVKDNDMRMTVVRGAIFADHYGERDEDCEFMDQGIQEFSYALLPSVGDWREADAARRALELNVQPIAIIETYHKGSLPQKSEGIRISVSNVIATAFKLSEDGLGYVLRCYETAGRDGEAEIEIPMLGRRWVSAFDKFEIKTLYIPKDSEAGVKEVNLIELFE